ncbi:tautomerase family protein [Streptomyces sp. AC563]|uniref:tautomerase family protein n=1 Tax=Streptomyces buecherae TaxID=2763006 RepID=UPI00164D04BC|nr:tautomerase family protein [Streptomyces buecherae]MBC3992530.1 tautomerase family protein [Streptomyces buecherae]
MPHFQVRVHEEELDGEVEGRLIRSLTEALVQVYGERARAMAVVEIFGVPRQRWGVGGVPASVHAPLVSLHVREAALSLPGISDAPGRLIRAITDAVADACGQSVRDHVSVHLIGVPAGRSGVGGAIDPPPPS